MLCMCKQFVGFIYPERLDIFKSRIGSAETDAPVSRRRHAAIIIRDRPSGGDDVERVDDPARFDVVHRGTRGVRGGCKGFNHVARNVVSWCASRWENDDDDEDDDGW